MSASGDGSDRQPLAYYEAVPYLLVLESVERGGRWLRQLWDRGASIPVPRPPLR